MDLMFLAHNRYEFTRTSLDALITNTDWSAVERFFIYDDDSRDGTREYLKTVDYPISPVFRFSHYGSPVTVMNDYLTNWAYVEGGIFGKIDSDTMVPPGWLNECMKVMYLNPGLDLLGIEVFTGIDAGAERRGYQPARHIGGIGLMRSQAFSTLPRPYGRFGFTEWQLEAVDVVKGWIDPALPVFLLDRLPMDPWRTYSEKYITLGWQRRWTPYSEQSTDLWSWWAP